MLPINNVHTLYISFQSKKFFASSKRFSANFYGPTRRYSWYNKNINFFFKNHLLLSYANFFLWGTKQNLIFIFCQQFKVIKNPYINSFCQFLKDLPPLTCPRFLLLHLLTLLLSFRVSILKFVELLLEKMGAD